MNTIRSVGYGWGVLILAGGGAYYFAKRSINADRAERAAAENERRRRYQQQYEFSQIASKPTPPRANKNGSSISDFTNNPSAEAAMDPAPTRHAPETSGQRITEKSKYESSEPFRSKKGDRFSSI